ncbi:hypothetical protein WR25_11770 [Diploscapter pachys]|uniref:CUB domain-containing protein n=1 Tax=Diploscapter pachys TaxID=2018661 RepID=A0A2A2JX09_9BILA|nr:hypothetical protein WR25_11770 [Diploscapter pachys]
MYNWADAQSYCTSIGGNSISLRYGTENDLANNMTRSLVTPPWTAVYYNTTGKSWGNVDGSTFIGFWAKGEPNQANGNCASYRSTADTNGFACTQCYDIQPAFCKQPGSVCNGGNFGGPSTRKGTITSPNYPNTYYNNLDCQYMITSPNGTYITINFDPFIVEGSVDYVSIFDGPVNSSSTLIAKITASTEKRQYETTGNQLLVWFHTDYSIVKDGWSAYWEARTITPPIYQNGSSGVLTSPNYPNDYPTYVEQLYFVTATPGFQVQANIDDFATENRFDQLLVFDGLVQTSEFQVANLSGSTGVAPWNYVFTNNTFSLRFFTDGSVQYKGWHLKWSLAEH